MLEWPGSSPRSDSHERGSMARVWREVRILIICVLLVAVLVPVLILLSSAMTQSMDAGTEAAFDYLAELRAGLGAGEFASWAILLGPYLLFMSFRLLRWSVVTIREKTRTRRVERGH